jgi:hypothetical protein
LHRRADESGEKTRGVAMHVIDLDATGWKTILDFYDALLPELGAPAGHGRSVDALIDSMIWGGINALEPPVTVRVWQLASAPQAVRDAVELTRRALAEARAEFHARKGDDVDVRLKIVP